MEDRTWAFLEAIKNLGVSISGLVGVFQMDGNFRPDLQREMTRMIKMLKILSDSIRKSGSWGDLEKERYVAIDKRMDAILDIGAGG